MKEALTFSGCAVYAVMGFVQWFAVVDGIQVWLGLPWILAALVSVVVAYIPLVGTFAGINGAVVAWGWSFGSAIGLFCWPYLLYFLAIVIGGAKESRNM